MQRPRDSRISHQNYQQDFMIPGTVAQGKVHYMEGKMSILSSCNINILYQNGVPRTGLDT